MLEVGFETPKRIIYWKQAAISTACMHAYSTRKKLSYVLCGMQSATVHSHNKCACSDRSIANFRFFKVQVVKFTQKHLSYRSIYSLQHGACIYVVLDR